MAAMPPDYWERIKDVFNAALEMDPASRGSFLDSACADDAIIRLEVDRLLSHHKESACFLDRPLASISGQAGFRPTTFLAGETVNARFRIVRFLGKGGMGEVYEAADEAIGGARVALKTIRSGMEIDDRLQAQFRHEVQIARRITHPNVCRIHDLFDCRLEEPILGGTFLVLFLTMEFLDGESLAERLSRAGPMSTEEALPLVRDIGGALEAAHQAGVVHRDLKSSNVMLVKARDGSTRAVLTDFGLADNAARTPDADSLGGQFAGTPDYMAPEQLEGREIDGRTDLFSLGVVIYEMITGKRPFPASSTMTGAGRRTREAPIPPRTHVPDVDPRWETAILKCLEVDPQNRFPNAVALIASLEGGASRIPRRTVITGGSLAAAMLSVLVYRGRQRPSAAGPAISSLAVLSFQNLSGEKSLDYFADGLAEELTQMLSRIRGLRVIARNSSRQVKANADPKSAGKQFNVAAVLTGGIRKQGGRVSVTAQLTSVPDGMWLWSGSFDEDDRNLSRVRVNLCLSISGALQPRLKGAQLAAMGGAEAENSQAYNLYLMGRHHASYRTDEGLKRSADYLSQSIALEPNFSMAHASLADSYNLLAGHPDCPPAEYFPKAEQEAKRALDLDPRLGQAHVALGSVCQRFRWDWTGAEQHFRAAIELNPGLAVAHHWYAGFLSNLGRSAEALNEIRTALDLDPLSPSVHTAYAVFLYRARRYDDSIEEFKRTLNLFPSYTVAVPQLAEVYAQKEMWDEAIGTYRKAVEMGGENHSTRAGLGETLARSGHPEEARALARELEAEFGTKHYSATSVAYVYRGLGDKDLAFRWFEVAFRRHEPALMILKVDPANDSLRSDIRFSQLLERIRL